MKTTSLINCSNLHVGGGVQVASSIVTELDNLRSDYHPPSLLISTEVAQSIGLQRTEREAKLSVSDTFGPHRPTPSVHRYIDSYTCVLTLFGPLYRWTPPFRSIVGFAQPWIIYPDNECYAMLPLAQRIKTRLKFRIQAMFFKRADALVVELEHVKEGLIRELGYPADRIYVVHNCLSSIYHDETQWQDVALPPSTCDLRLGFVGRNYPHKNTAIFPDIAAALRQRHGIDAKFYVTFTEDEWRACSPDFRDACINVGPLSVAQCPKFYRSLDGVVFPSLLECFSATPLEAMAMERPLFASDMPFNRDICGDHAHYFNPSAPFCAADRIAAVFAGNGPDSSALRRARDHAIGFASPRERAEKYLEILRIEANKNGA